MRTRKMHLVCERCFLMVRLAPKRLKKQLFIISGEKRAAERLEEKKRKTASKSKT